MGEGRNPLAHFFGRKDNGISEKGVHAERRNRGGHYTVLYRNLQQWDERHREFNEVWEETLNRRALRLPKNMDEQLIDKERDELLYRLIDGLPEIQKRRFLLYYDYDLNYYQIGEMEHCNVSAARNSVVIARKKSKCR